MVVSIGRWSLPMSSIILIFVLLWISAETKVRSGRLVVPCLLCKHVGWLCSFWRRWIWFSMFNASTSLPMLLYLSYPNSGRCALKSPAIIVLVFSSFMLKVEEGSQSQPYLAHRPCRNNRLPTLSTTLSILESSISNGSTGRTLWGRWSYVCKPRY